MYSALSGVARNLHTMEDGSTPGPSLSSGAVIRRLKRGVGGPRGSERRGASKDGRLEGKRNEGHKVLIIKAANAGSHFLCVRLLDNVVNERLGVRKVVAQTLMLCQRRTSMRTSKRCRSWGSMWGADPYKSLILAVRWRCWKEQVFVREVTCKRSFPRSHNDGTRQ
jgi:hypothetical protein